MKTELQKEHEARMKMERDIVAKLIDFMKTYEWNVVEVDDGGERVPTRNKTAAMKAVFSVDESTIFFKHPNHQRRGWVYVVLGNCGHDSLSDNSCGDSNNFGALMDDFSEIVEEEFCS